MSVKQHNDEDLRNPANRIHSDQNRNPAAGKQLHDQEQQAAYNDDFAAITSPENYGRDGKEPNAADDLSNRENEFNYPTEPSARSARRPRPQNFVGKAKNFLKKKGPIAGLISMLVAGGAAFSILLAPGISIMHFKELLTSKVNDQIGAVNTKTPVLIANKLNNQKAAGLCTSKVNIHCKFSTSSKRQIAKFEKAGFVFEGKTDAFGGRVRYTSMQFPDGGPKVDDPGQLIRLMRTQPKLQSHIYRAYYPKAASLSNKFDKSVAHVFAKFGVSKASMFKGTKKADYDKQLRDGTRGVDTQSRLQAGDLSEDTDDETRNKLLGDAETAKAELDTDKPLSIDEAKKKFTKGAGMLAGVQSACGIYTLSNIVEGSAQTIRAMQLVQFAQVVVLNPADQIKSGDASPELAEYIGDKITQTDTRKTIEDPEDSSKTIENPAYGKSAMDSPIFKTIAYNDAPTLPYRSAQFMVGGGLVGEFAGFKDALIDHITGGVGGEEAVRTTCGIVNSPVGIAISIVGMFTGVGTIIGLAGLAAGLAFEQLLLPLLLQQATNTLAGEVVDENTANVDIGDAVSTGTATMLGTVAQERGMVPMNAFQFNAYLAHTQSANEQMIAAEIEGAKKTPFDLSNQYSFLGMFSRAVAPSILSSKQSAVGVFQLFPSFLSTSLSTITDTVSADTGINPARFEKCEDTNFDKIGMQADVACFPRYGLPTDEINMPVETSVQYMIDNGHIKEDDLSGSPIPDTDYHKWVRGCTAQRSQGWGISMEETDLSDDLNSGKACLDMTNEQYKFFRAYHFANSLADGMELEEVPKDLGGQSSNTGGGENSGNIRDDGWAWPGPKGTTACGFDCYGGHFGMDVNAPDRSNIYAARDGKVIHAGVDPYMTAALCPVGGLNGAQQTIVITHTINGQKVDTYYTHLTAGSFKVKVGDEVKAGDLIGLSGSTGCSTGAHLHMGIYQGGWPTVSNAIDPTSILGRSG